MKVKVENVLIKGRVEAEDLEDELDDTGPIDMWKDDSFTGSEHPAVVHVRFT